MEESFSGSGSILHCLCVALVFYCLILHPSKQLEHPAELWFVISRSSVWGPSALFRINDALRYFSGGTSTTKYVSLSASLLLKFLLLNFVGWPWVISDLVISLV